MPSILVQTLPLVRMKCTLCGAEFWGTGYGEETWCDACGDILRKCESEAYRELTCGEVRYLTDEENAEMAALIIAKWEIAKTTIARAKGESDA
jgi:hypothetical protein